MDEFDKRNIVNVEINEQLMKALVCISEARRCVQKNNGYCN